MNAVYGRNVGVARFLVGHGVNINFRNPRVGSTPILSTICWDYGERTALRDDLLKAGADPDASTTDKVTPIITCAAALRVTPFLRIMPNQVIPLDH